MTDGTIAQFVAALVIGSARDRAPGAGLPGAGARHRPPASGCCDGDDDAEASPLGSTEGFEQAWETVAEKMLTSYSDEPFVSDDYARELSGARTKAIDVEQLPATIRPNRSGRLARHGGDAELRKLDLTLVLDLLRIEPDAERWATSWSPVVA